MRQAVRKPSKRLHLSELHAVAPASVAAPRLDVALTPKLSFTTVDDRRATRARHVAKSRYVSRFGDAPTPAGVRVVRAAIPVAAKPVVQIQPLAPAPRAQQRSMDIFERALKQANAHEQAPPARKERAAKKPPKTKSRLAGGLAASLAVVVLGGFLAYQNMANVTVRVAAARAGFAASLPGYKPAGFSVGRFAYSPGHVTINFSSGSDGRHFALTEQPSNWDSATLLNDFVASAADQYQTVQTAGRTLYIYGKNNATWVNGGVWYRVDSDNALSTTQLVNLASSM